MSSSTLKIIALITMFIDHIGAVFFPEYFIFRMIGRISFPLFAFLVSQGCEYTKNYKKYLFRLFIFALISEIPYDLCFNYNVNFFYETNVIYTMFLGATLIFVSKKIDIINLTTFSKYILKIMLLTIICLIAVFLKTDYDAIGIIMIYIFSFYRKEEKNYALFILQIILIKLIDYNQNNIILFLFNILPLLFIYLYNFKKGLNLKWIFYISYPLHLFIIYIVGRFLI